MSPLHWQTNGSNYSVGSDLENLVAHRATKLKDLVARNQILVAQKIMERKAQTIDNFRRYLFVSFSVHIFSCQILY